MNQISKKLAQNLNLVGDNSSIKIINILLIEDNPGDIRLIQELMKEIGNGKFNLLYQENLGDGMRILNEEQFHVILLDLSKVDNNNYQFLLKI